MGAMQPRDYLSHLPAPPELDFPHNPVLASEVFNQAQFIHFIQGRTSFSFPF
jgi:hypothetical protein